MKKYLNKETITSFLKYFVKSFIITFVPTVIVLALILYLFMGINSEAHSEVILMLKVVFIFCVAAPIVNYPQNNSITETNQLTTDNYWKLKKELDKKVNKPRKKK